MWAFLKLLGQNQKLKGLPLGKEFGPGFIIKLLALNKPQKGKGFPPKRESLWGWG